MTELARRDWAKSVIPMEVLPKTCFSLALAAQQYVQTGTDC